MVCLCKYRLPPTNCMCSYFFKLSLWKIRSTCKWLAKDMYVAFFIWLKCQDLPLTIGNTFPRIHNSLQSQILPMETHLHGVVENDDNICKCIFECKRILLFISLMAAVVLAHRCDRFARIYVSELLLLWCDKMRLEVPDHTLPKYMLCIGDDLIGSFHCYISQWNGNPVLWFPCDSRGCCSK